MEKNVIYLKRTFLGVDEMKKGKKIFCDFALT